MSQTRLLAWSLRLYRVLLLTYPADFRRDHRWEMSQIFCDCCREELSNGGITRLLQFWGLILLDYTKSVSREQFTQLKKMLGFTKEPFMNSLDIQVALNTDIGTKRQKNEDAMLSVIPEETALLQQKGALFLVADGMGGHRQGEVASDMAVTTIRESYYQDGDIAILASLQNAFQQANQHIHQANAATQDKEKHMLTTCVAAVIKDQTLYIANVGDSLAYLVRDTEMQQLAEDHTLVGSTKNQGLG